MRSLRFKLLALWAMLLVSGAAPALLLIESFRQTSNARIARSEETAARGCREISDRYQFFVSGWGGAPVDDALKLELAVVVQTALANAVGVEGGIWQGEAGSLAYAFPTYEGSGPKTDLPAAELTAISQVNAEALRSGRPALSRQTGRSQTLLVYSCPLRGPLNGLTGWTMTRASTTDGAAYNQLLAGLGVLALTILGSAMWLARILYSWTQKISRLEAALGARDPHAVDLPALPRTGERELDRLVDALNLAGDALTRERARAAVSERLAAVGRLSAGLAHEIRNPIAAMRLKAENALASNDHDRSRGALDAILRQIARLDALLRDLLDMTHSREPVFAEVDLQDFLERTIEAHEDTAVANGIKLSKGTGVRTPSLFRFDASQMQRALDNLILNAIQNTPEGGAVTVGTLLAASSLVFRVEDNGVGIPLAIRDRLFEPFVTGRPDGTGLGLAVAKEIARAHGGDLRLAESSSGTAFEIEIPWQRS